MIKSEQFHGTLESVMSLVARKSRALLQTFSVVLRFAVANAGICKQSKLRSQQHFSRGLLVQIKVPSCHLVLQETCCRPVI